MDKTFKNYERLPIRRVVVGGIRIYDTFDKRNKYVPVLTMFFNDIENEPPACLNFSLSEVFDDGEVMARMTVIWANNMFPSVARKVSIHDYESGDLVVTHDVMDLEDLEVAQDELAEIHRTNVMKIH